MLRFRALAHTIRAWKCNAQGAFARHPGVCRLLGMLDMQRNPTRTQELARYTAVRKEWCVSSLDWVSGLGSFKHADDRGDKLLDVIRREAREGLWGYRLPEDWGLVGEARCPTYTVPPLQ